MLKAYLKLGHEKDPIVKINGLKVSTVSEKWYWKCKTKVRGSKNCDEAQKFLLATELEFLEIPNVWHHQNTTRFWLKQVINNSGGKMY